MSKNPFLKYVEAATRQDENYSYLRAGTPSLAAEYADIKLQPQYVNKTLNDYAGDTAVDATKATMTLAQTGISALDLAAYSIGGLSSTVQQVGHELAPNTIPQPQVPAYGQITKVLDDGLGFNINKAKQTLGELGYSDIRKKQEAELHSGYSEKEIEAFKNQWTNQFSLQYQDLANKGASPLQLEAFKSKFEDNYKQAYIQMMDKYQTSMDKSFGENAAIVGKAFDTVLDNPALGFGAAIESTGYLVPSLAVSRGIAALQGAKLAATAGGKAVAAGTGEGLVSALALNEQMRGNSATGTIDGTKVAAGFAGGGVTALIGGVSNRLGSRFGLDDVDSLGLGTQAKGFSVTRPVLASAQEGAEEFLQGFGESIIPNIAEGKDPLQGLAQELALGTAAGSIMGATMNAKSLVSGAGSDLVSGFNKVAEAVGKGKDAITAKTFEELNDPTNKNYDPAKAFNSQVPKTNSQDDAEREEALANMESVFGNLETHRSNLINEKDIAEGILKNIAALPPEEQAKNLKAKGQAENLVKDLDARIIAAENQTMDLFEQKFTLGKNQEVQAGVPQYSEEQAKQDIEVLSQQPTTAVWRNQDTDLPVSVLGETQLDEAGQEYTKVSYTDAATGNVSENFVPSSELVQDTTTQQEAVDRVTKHFSKLSLDELDTVAKSPYLSEEQRNSLRYLSETKRAIADMADTGTVTRHILNGLKGKTAAESHRGLNNYSDMISKAISTKDEKLLNIALNDLGRFAQDHTDKANALVEAHQLAVSGKFPNLQVLRTKNGTWGIVTDPNKFVDDIKLKATGGWNVHRNSNIKGSIDAVTKEATVIQDTLKSLTQVSLSFGLQAVEPTVTAPVSIEALKEANKPVTTSTQNTADITSAVTRLNGFMGNKTDTDIKVDNVTPEVLNQIETKVATDFELGTVNQQTYAGVSKDINTLRQYLTNAATTTPNQEVVTPAASTQTEATEAVNEKAANGELSNYINHSGGAIGSDTAWDKIGASYGMGNNKHYYTGQISDKNAPLGNTELSPQDLEEGAVESAKAAKRNFGYQYSRMKDVRLIRNWAQVKYSDAIYAIGTLVKTGEALFPKQTNDIRKAAAPSVTGGTGYAVGMAINHNKPVYVFNQTKGSYDIGWYKWDISSNDFVKVDTPVLTKNFAGIGTREINAAGVQAIKDAYAKTQSAGLGNNDSNTNTQTEPTQTSSSTPEASRIYAELPSKSITGNVVKAAWNNLKNATQAIKDKVVISTRIPNTNEHFGNPFSSDTRVLANNPQLIKTNSTGESVERYIDWVINSKEARAAWIREQLQSGKLKGKSILYYTELNEASHANALDYLINKYDWGTVTKPVEAEESSSTPSVKETQTEATEAVNAEPQLDTTPPVEAATAEGTTDVSEAPNTKETQTSDDAEALIEDLETEAKKRVTLEDEDTLKLDALNNLISLAHGHEITDEGLGDIAQVFGEDLLNEALRIKGLPLSKREQAQRYLEQVRTAIEGILNVELYIDSVSAKKLKKYKDTLLGLMTKRGKNTDNAKKIFEILEDYVGTAKEGVTTKSESEVESDETSSTNSPNDQTGEAANTGSQESGDNNTESIIENTTSTGQASGEATTVTNQTEIEDGKVTVLQGVTEAVREEERAKPFSLRNLIKAYFTQKKSDASNSPLVLVKDFISNLNVANALSKYLSDDTKVNTKQVAQVEHFQKFAKNFAPVIARVFQGEFSKDPKNNLVRDLAVDGVLDENILTAIAVAAYGYLIRYSEPYNTDDSIRDIVRITKEDAIPPQVAQLLRYAGQEAPYVEADLGKEITKLLGLKALNDSSADLQSRLEKAFGSLTTAALNDVGYVSVHTDVSHKAIGYLMRNAGYTGNEASGIDDGLEGTENLHALEKLGKLTFIRVNYKVDDNAPVIAINKAENIDPVKVLRPARNKDGLIIIKPLVWGTDLDKTSPNDLSDILKNSEETKGILDKVFNNDVGYIKPLMVEPEALDAKTKQGTNNSISKTQKELVEEGQKTAFSIRANTVNVLRTLKGLTDDSKLLKQLLGIWVDDDVTARTHITDRESLEAKANNEWRTLTNGLEWADITSLGNDEYAEFYDAQYVTQNERMQYLSNMFNMQGSQIHRAMASLSAFKLEIDLTDTSSANENLQRFYQAVGEGLEKLDKDLQDSIKKKAGLQQFFTVDKVSADNYVEALQEYLAGEISTNAIAAMIKVLAGKTPTDTEQKAIALFVEKGGMGIQSLQSLIALAEMQVAINQGKSSFTTTVGLGSDGVNNGVASANILTGVITREMKQQVGMLPKIPTKNDPVPFTNMQEVYAKGKPDYYISFGAVMGRFLGLLRDKDTEKNKQWRDSVQALFPLYKAIQEASLEMRKIAKTWSIPFNYGAGKKSLQRALARGFMSGIYSDMNKIANKAIDLKEALAKGHLVEGGITKEVFDVEMAALRLKANTLQDNINNILKRGWSEGKDKNGNTAWKTAFKIQFPKDLTKLNDYNFDEAQVGQMSYGKMVFEGDAYKGTSKDIVYSLTQAVTALHGQAAWKATEEYAREYTKVRDLLNTTHTATYMLYENMRTDLIQAKLRNKRAEALGTVEARNKEINASNAAILEEYKKQGKDAVRKAKADTRWEEPTPIKDLVKEFEYLGLTTEELREIDSILKPVAPVLHSALSRETNNLNAGITLATTEDKVAKASDNKQVATSYVNKYTKKPRTNTSGLSFKAEMTSGIKALAMAVQGIDAYVAAYLQAKFPTLNVHDAGIFGLKYFVEATKYQNEIYLQAMVNYHLNTESVESLMRSYLGLKDFIASLDSLGLDEIAKAKFINQIKIVEDNILNKVAERNPDGTVKLKTITDLDGKTSEVEDRKGVFKGLNNALVAFGTEPKGNLIEALQALVLQAIQQDLAKLQSLKDLKSVHQYSGEGGAFIIGGKGSDLSEAEHLRRIEAQEELLKLKERTLLQQLEREATVLDLVSGKNTKDTSLITFLNANKGKEVDVKDIVTILKAVPASAKSEGSFQQQLAIIREIAPLLDGVKVIYEDVANNEEEGIDDYVQGFYNEDTNRITIRANSKYPPTAKLVLHELLHSGLAARITYLQNLPKDSEEYQDARVALQRLESLRKEILSNLVEGVDASKYFELEAAFKDVGGWEAYKKAQESLKNNKEYQGALTRIETLKTLLKEALQKRKEQNTRYTALNAEFEAERKGLKFGSEEYSAVWLRQQQSLDELKQEQQETKQAIAAINLKLKKADAIVTDKESAELVTVKTAKAFLKLHNTLKNTVFTINGTTEINGLTVVNQLIDIHEFISYGLTEQYLQDIMEAVVQVKNTAERKGTYWGIFVKAIARILKIGKGETIDALSAFAMDVANTIKAIRESNVPRAESTTPTIRKSTTTQAEDQVNQMSSIEVMQTLPHTGNSDFGLHLNNLAEKVISQVYNNDEVAKAEIDVIQAIRALPAIKAGFNLSQREAAIQHSLELVLQTYLETSKGGLNVGQLWKIYAEAQKNIKVSDFYDGDWSKATAQEVAATQQKYNYVINSSGKGVESLARFISMGLATEEVHNLLGFNTVTAKPSKQKSWFDTLNGWVRYIASWLGGKLVKTSPLDPAYKQLQGLVNNLTALDIRNRQAVVSIFDKAWNLVGKATQPLDTAVQKLRQYATNRDFLRNSKYLPLRTLGSIASLDAKAIGETIPALIRETRDKARPNEKLGEAMTALMESTAMSAIRKSMEALIRQANLNAKDRQDRNDNVKKAIMAWFKDNGKHISKEMHKAITYTLLRTDAQSLLTTFGLDKTIGLLLDTNKLKNEIDLVTKNISQYKNGVDMIHAAEDLGYYMVSNKGGMGLSKNPAAIAAGIGTNYQIALEDVDQALVGQLDVLASLFAMKYTSAKDRKVLGEMYKENPEALHGLLNMHKGFMADAETEFKDNPLNYIKGWMPEIVNPYREVRAASGIDERDQMLKEGWKVIEEVKPHGKFLMVHADIGYQRLVSGAVDLQNSHRKGTEIVNRQSKQYLSTVKANLAYTAHRASIPLGQYDPTKKPTGLIPTYDTDGVPMAFNYEMASWVRDKEMERNNNFADLMGSYAGAMFYKPAKRNQSVTVANALFEDYKQNYQKHPNSYIKLSGKSSDPRIVEMWRMLPKDFRQRATELYGKGEPIVINNEAFLLAFGFKKWSITNIWNKPESERTPMETMFVTMADNILKGTAKAKIAKAGHIWTEAVSKAKDFIVIRSISVLWYNVIANGLMLMAHGINPLTIGKEWAFATANVRAYQTLNSELIQLKANTLAGKGNSATEAQIKRIESQLEANPMSRYINAGLLSSIVEDVTIQQGDYSYDSELKKKIDNVTGWLPDSVKTLGAWAVFSPSTKAYQFLATTTQLSDFVAKVTLAKHLESKGMDFKAAISEASQTFINYDVPQGVGMQYMNDIGLFMFTKFFLRIQAILFKLLDKKAATVLAQHIAVESLTDIQGILAPSAAGSIGNWPFEGGALTLPGAAMSIAPVNAGLGLAGF